MDILVDLIEFLVGLAAIVKGADWLTDGAASIARHYGIPSIVVGLTIVAMGSSAPEFVVSVVSALQGNTDMALGNVVGSNIFNILAIMGITALVRPIKVEHGNVRNDVPFVVLSSIAIALSALDSYFNNGAENSISRTDGLLLLCMFAIFMSYTFSMAKPSASKEEGKADAEGADIGAEGADISVQNKADGSSSDGSISVWKSIGMVIVGLAGLILGGNWLVEGASGLAIGIGIPESVVALTIVSAGTSAPELAASIMAARKGDTAMALGNVVGSCVFNVFFVLGSAATVQQLGIGGITAIDILVLLAASIVLWLVCKCGKTHYTITRFEGSLLTAMMIAYYVYLVMSPLTP